ncbi:extracellular solute-binding protein [Natrinema salifodinae]|uniref:Carbohydrate ABC transporter substrate-binding protein, CUT1 family n=1 Tax=Natrinema salifodinae TaxID=1202768 RepID=A0A1I0QTP9_9EURY|nr:extracellular solute-binding protein [Natrinema salifodinae]SEW31017.1 carbohydrate ABC transporter substrate-binding protein, CUT1 family [Natrinema salifodinae]
MPTSGSGDDNRHRGASSVRSAPNARSSRRRFLTGVAGTAAATGIAGCLGGGGSDNDVNIIAVEGEGRLVQNLIDEYVEAETELSIDVTLFPYANLYERVNSVLTTGGTGYDAILIDDTWFPQFATYFDPLEQWLPEGLPEDQLIDTTVDIATWPTPDAPTVPSAEGMDETVRGQVVVGNTQMFVYNTAYYEEVGEDEPQNWDDVLRAGQRIDDEIDGANGYVIRGQRGNPIDTNFMSLGRSLAGDMFDEDWRYQWNDGPGEEAVQFFVEELNSISPDGVASFDSDQVLNRIGDGSAAQGLAWPAASSTLLNPEDAEEADNLEFIPIPEGDRQAPTQGNWMLGINANIADERKEDAGEVIQTIISKEAQDRYVELGGVPFRHDTFEDNMDAEPWYEALYESLQNAVPRPRTPLWNEIDITQGEYLNSALTGEIDPSDALDEIENDVESILGGADYY